MKKWIACVLVLSALSVLLCGCGAGMDGSNAVVETPRVTVEPSMIVTPMPTPDAEDGIVTDRDGIIEEKEQPGAVQSSPAVTAAPGANTKSAT